MRKPKPIWSILERTLKALEMDVPLKVHSVLGAWKEIVGDSVAFQTQPRSIRNRILFIDVSHPTWIHQLQFLKPTLLEKVNGFLGKPHIQDIRFKLGKISPIDPPVPRDDAWRREDLDATRLKCIEHLVQQIDDDEVKKALKEVLIKGAKLEQYRKNLEGKG